MKRKLIYILLPLILLFACLGFVACGEKLPRRLSTPQNVRVEGQELVWDSVEYADGYSLLIEQREYETTENRFNMSAWDETELPIELMAYSDRAIGNSQIVKFEFVGRFARPTKGLEFEIVSNKSGDTLKVSKMAVDENGVCVIPATYGGYKVTSFKTSTLGGSMAHPTYTPHEACPKIKTLYIPYAVAGISRLECQVLPNLEEIVVGKDLENGETRYVSEGNCIIDKQNDSVLVGCINSVIPDYVTKIASGAFGGRNITSFTVPDQITEIGIGAFGGCTALTEFHLPKGFTAEKFHFLNGCSALTDITIPEGVVNLNEAFSACSSLKEVRIPESVEFMDLTFMDCTALERCVVPPKVKSLKGTFINCTSLKEVVLPGGLEEINCFDDGRLTYPTFYKCTALTSIVLPSSLITIGENSFKNCPLEVVYYGGSEAEWKKIEIDETGNDALLAAARYYYSATQPTVSGNFWHYVNGVPTKWAV